MEKKDGEEETKVETNEWPEIEIESPYEEADLRAPSTETTNKGRGVKKE